MIHEVVFQHWLWMRCCRTLLCTSLPAASQPTLPLAQFSGPVVGSFVGQWQVGGAVDRQQDRPVSLGQLSCPLGFSLVRRNGSPKSSMGGARAGNYRWVVLSPCSVCGPAELSFPW